MQALERIKGQHKGGAGSIVILVEGSVDALCAAKILDVTTTYVCAFSGCCIDVSCVRVRAEYTAKTSASFDTACVELR